MKKIFLFLFLLTVASLSFTLKHQKSKDFSTLSDQEPNVTDSLLAKEYQQKGKEFGANREFDSAAHYAAKSSSIFQKLEMWDEYQDVGADLVLAMIYMRNLDSANVIDQKIRTAFENRLTTDTTIYKKLLNMQGAIFSLTGKLDSGIVVMEKLLLLDKKYFKDSLTMVMAGTYNNLGTLYTDYQVFDKALKYYDSAAYIHQKLLGDDSEYAARMYSNKAIALKAMGNINQSLASNKRSYEVFKKLLPENHPRLALALLNISNDILDQKNSQNNILEAKSYIENAGQILKNGKNEGHTYMIDYFRFSAKANQYLNNLDLSLKQYDKALALETSIYGAEHPDIAKIRVEKAQTWLLKGEYDLSNKALDKALAAYSKSLGENFAGVAKAFVLKAEIEVAQGRHDEALSLYQKAIAHFAPEIDETNVLSNPLADDLIPNQELLSALKNKARLTHKLFDEKNEIKYLKASLGTYDLLSNYIKLTRKGFFGAFAKLNFNERNDQVYEESIKTALRLFEETKDEIYILKAIQFSDSYKSGILLEEIKDTKAKVFANIPSELIEEESSLRASINLYKKELFNLKSTKETDPLLSKELEEKLFALNARLEVLSNRAKGEFSAYHQLHFDADTFDINNFRNSSLADGQLAVQFFIGGDTFYVFALSKENVIYHSETLDPNLGKDVAILLGSIKDKNRDSFANKAFDLYEYILMPVLVKGQESGLKSEHLIIIPDGILGYIPFEVLLTQKPQPQDGYKDLTYLVKEYQITNHYSANLMTFQGNAPKKISQKSFLGFAPTFIDKKSSQHLALNERTRAFMDTLTALPNAKNEVQQIADLLNGQANIGASATEAKFKKAAGDYNILHLASHSVIEDDAPLYSKLLFDNEADTLEDGFLHTYELYNMQLNADLVCLSSCNTGIGKLYKGEGIASLARGFMYAGVPNLVMSLWSVSDKPTKDLMVYFYEELKAGNTKSTALRKAKLRYLEQADDVTANPYYWGAFVYLGQPDEDKKTNRWWLWLLGLVPLLSFFIYKSRQ